MFSVLLPSETELSQEAQEHDVVNICVPFRCSAKQSRVSYTLQLVQGWGIFRCYEATD